MRRTDVFAHALLPAVYGKLLELAPDLPKQYPFFNNPALQDMERRKALWDGETRQILSWANANPEDVAEAETAAALCREANRELADTVDRYPEMFAAGVGMLPMNHIPEAVRIVEEQIAPDPRFHGVQLFTRHMGRSVADRAFRPVLDALHRRRLLVWLHPVFDERKPDNNVVFSWEYELTQAMLQLVQSGIFRDLPNLRVIVHHAGAMAPFFAGRIDRILPREQAEDFRRFYVDTAILGNPGALNLAASFFGADHLLFGTDAPFGILPAGATSEILEAVRAMSLTEEEREGVLWRNYAALVRERLSGMKTGTQSGAEAEERSVTEQ